MSQKPNKIEQVVLLDEEGSAIGTISKERVHTANTPLHSAFSIFLFDGKGKMLVQQRALSKKTWPEIWSNACCGHPLPGEVPLAAANRRLTQELGLYDIELSLALPDFRYRAEFQGIVENEICPVFIGLCQQQPVPNPEEVAAVDWVEWKSFTDACNAKTNTWLDSFSPWSLLEGKELQEYADIGRYVGCQNAFVRKGRADYASRRSFGQGGSLVSCGCLMINSPTQSVRRSEDALALPIDVVTSRRSGLIPRFPLELT